MALLVPETNAAEVCVIFCFAVEKKKKLFLFCAAAAAANSEICCEGIKVREIGKL